MHYSSSPRDPISLQGPHSLPGHFQQPAHTNILLTPTTELSLVAPPHGQKKATGNVPEKRDQRLQT